MGWLADEDTAMGDIMTLPEEISAQVAGDEFSDCVEKLIGKAFGFSK